MADLNLAFANDELAVSDLPCIDVEADDTEAVREGQFHGLAHQWTINLIILDEELRVSEKNFHVGKSKLVEV